MGPPCVHTLLGRRCRPAETLVNGNKYAMEMQVLFCTGNCKSDKDISFYAGDDAEDPDNFAIYSVLFEEGDPDAASAIAVRSTACAACLGTAVRLRGAAYPWLVRATVG